MKKLFVMLAVLVTLQIKAQTNSIVFPVLLSCTNTPLMTNAEFRCIIGNRIAFCNEGKYGVFAGSVLNSNVLATLGITLDDLNQKQANLAAKKAAENAQFQAQLQAVAYRHYLEQLAAQRAAAQAQAANDKYVRDTLYQAQHQKVATTRTMITGGDAINGYQTTTVTTSP